MNTGIDRARWRALGTAALLLVAGTVIGILAERLWLSPSPAEAPALTADAMAARLELSVSEEAHLRALLDSLQAEIHAAVQQDADSLRVVTRHAEQRIEAALPSDVRAEFRAWLQEHHEQVMGRMHHRHRDPDTLHGGGSGGDHPPDDGHHP